MTKRDKVNFHSLLNRTRLTRYVNNEECLATLYFDNTRYNKISKEHKHSLEWLWTHAQYLEWSTSQDSRLLYIQGKPGSGKSTLTKYFRDNLQLESSSAIVANHFYSEREGESQRNHYGMLRSILYGILNQREAMFFLFQSEYRKCGFIDSKCTWSYESLRKVLLSIGDYPVPQRIYLIIDAMDESDNNSEDRRDILQILFDLCSQKNGCIWKVFITSRPIGVLEHRIREFHNFIRLQDETKDDINNFVSSFLSSDLNFTGSLRQRATNYITEHAQGVFVWVSLVRKELLHYAEIGYSEREIIDVLKSLPTELEDFYARIFTRLNGDNQRNIWDAIGMFELVLFTFRPLTVTELQHALAVRNDTAEFPSDESFKENLIEEFEKRIIHCGGNFLEIKEFNGNKIVQVMHQTAREFLLRPIKPLASSSFRISQCDADINILKTCIQYLRICAANTSLQSILPNTESWTRKHFEVYARYLNERPLVNYALSHFKHHFD
ncbi:hypothetical protein K440DRAFT_554537, partial [Wilcoxina mikolae CBS 423.85]